MGTFERVRTREGVKTPVARGEMIATSRECFRKTFSHFFLSCLFVDVLTDLTKGSTVYLTHVRAKITRMLPDCIDDVQCVLTVVSVKDTHPT